MDEAYDSAYSADDVREWRNRQNYPKDENGVRHCKDCGAVAKTSQAGNLYCADLCWTHKTK